VIRLDKEKWMAKIERPCEWARQDAEEDVDRDWVNKDDDTVGEGEGGLGRKIKLP
jgi:hypothetical protein